MKAFKIVFLTLLLTLVPVWSMTFAASNPGFPGPNNGVITVNNSSTLITPTPFPNRYSITFLNPSTTITIYVCQATVKSTTTGFPTINPCSSAAYDILLSPGASFSTNSNGYTGQYTAITSSSTAPLVINEN